MIFHTMNLEIWYLKVRDRADLMGIPPISPRPTLNSQLSSMDNSHTYWMLQTPTPVSPSLRAFSGHSSVTLYKKAVNILSFLLGWAAHPNKGCELEDQYRSCLSLAGTLLGCISEGAQQWALAHSLRVICFSVETQTQRTDLWTQGLWGGRRGWDGWRE